MFNPILLCYLINLSVYFYVFISSEIQMNLFIDSIFCQQQQQD